MMNYERASLRKKMWLWTFALVLRIAIASASRSKHVNPSIVAEFKSEYKLKHLAYDEQEKQVFVGGVNRLYQLDSDLKLTAAVSIGPELDSPHCHSNGCSNDTAETTLTQNVNKVLVVDNESRTLIACGSILQGACNKYKTQNISLGSQFVPVAVAANDENSSTFAFIAPQTSSEKSNVLYVGTTFTFIGDYRHDVPAISSRNLDTLALHEDWFDKQSSIFIDVKSRDHFLVKYVYGFNSSDHAYFVIVQKKSSYPGEEEQGYVTRLARVCINDGNFGSYSEVTLQCGESDEYPDGYTLVQDAKLVPAGVDLAESYGVKTGDPVLVGVFSPPKGISSEPISQSAMCVFSLSKIETRFKENIHMCFNGSMTARGMDYISGPVLEGKCLEVGSIGNIVNFCEPGLGLKISGRVPIFSPFAVEFGNSLMTSIAATTTETHTLAFVGTSEGKLIKVLIESESQAYQFEEIVVDPGSPLLPDMTLDASRSHLYALSPNKVFKIRVEHCASYTNCSSCLEARDPYCGWCSLEKRCTIRGACQKATTGSPRWLAFGAGQQCIDFEQILPDRISINQHALVQLTIRTLPELPSGAKYKCVFGGADPIEATVTSSGLTCMTPPVASRPQILPSPRYNGPLENATVIDHVNVPLSVRSSETNKDFVSRNFAFFDCSRHTTCSSCVRSQWSCNWCIYENRCVSNATTCQRNVVSGENNPTRLLNHGVSFCPRLKQPVEQEGILVPSGVPKELVLEADNLPSPLAGQSGFQCVVHVEGAKMAVPARVEAGRFVVCDRTTFTYEAPIGEYEAYVTVVWNRDHYVGTLPITLYKCDALGSHRDHPDCSLCLTRQSKYRCAWCGSVCAYSEMCQLALAAECPRPRIDVIKPLSGPIEGGTLVTIEGSNLGLKEDDVRDRIRIGDIPCTLVDYQVSVRIVCRSGAAKEEMDALVSIGNAAGFTESTVKFSYRDVQLDRVHPLFGPQSGGTQLTITGQYLNIGTNISAYLDSYPCVVNISQSTSTRLVCTTSKSDGERKVSRLTISVDNATKVLTNRPFSYIKDPTILEIKPLKSFATGGRMISVHGTNLDCIQQPEMAVYMGDEMTLINKTHCRVLTQSQMECPSPPIDFPLLLEQHAEQLYGARRITTKRRRALRRLRSAELPRKHRDVPPTLNLRIGFLMDNVESVRDLKKYFQNIRSHVQYVEDPIFFPFAGKVKLYKGDTLVIEGENLNLACDETDVNVTIGTVPCNVTSLAATQLVCSPPDIQPSGTDENGLRTDSRLPLVVVRVGQNLRYPIGYLQYEMLKPYAFPPEAIAGIAGGALFLLLLSVVILLVYRRKSSQAEREYKRIQIQMDTLESNVRSECKQAFAELQTDMTDLTADLQSLGIPTLDHKSYVMKVFFPGVGDHPILSDPKRRQGGPKTNYDAAMVQFEQLINHRHFLLVFIETLEAQKSFNIRDKVNVASLLMVILMGNMEYATSILRALLIRLMDKAAASRHPQLMLRRTESMVEKMLANWMSLCMSAYLKEKAGPSLFLLFKAIKHQVEKGPVDAVTHDARYSLSEERLLKEQIDHSVVTIHLVQEDHYEKIPYHTYQPITEEIEEKIQCKVLDCDTISQVKLKILDALYRNTPFSLRPTVHEVELEYRPARTSPVILSDEDATSSIVGGWKRLNTLAHYGIRDSAIMALVPRRTTYTNTLPNGQCRHMYRTCLGIYTLNNSHHHTMHSHNHHVHHHHHHLNGNIDANSSQMPTFHLVRPPLDEHCLKGCPNAEERTPKAIPEIFLTRLLSTKGTIEKFVSDFFRTILSADESLPPAVKWLFDLLDEGAKKHNILDPEVLHAWKSNSLPLRFWVNFIKNPDFVFDINKTPTVDSCLSVIAQTFMDACSTSEHRLTKDSPSNKLLFAKDIPRFREMVSCFYQDVASLPSISEQEMNSWMQQLSVSHLGEFDTTAALKELYIYVDKYREQIFENLESDIYCRKMHLTHKLENVSCTMEGEETSTC